MAPYLSNLESNVKLLLEANSPPNKIATILKRNIKSIYNTISRIKKKSNIKERSKVIKKGVPYKITKRAKRAIKRDIIKSPKKTNKRVIIENDLGFTKRSLQRVLKEQGATTNIATKKAFISKEAAKLRLIYAKEQLKEFKKKKINLKKIIFSDESSIQRGHGARQEYYRKFGSIKAGKQMISSTNKSTF